MQPPPGRGQPPRPRRRPPALYLITDRTATRGRDLGALVAAALRGLAPFRDENGQLPVAIMLREKDLSATAQVDLAKLLLAHTRAFGAELFVNGRLDVAVAAGVDGIHLPSAGLRVSE